MTVAAACRRHALAAALVLSAGAHGALAIVAATTAPVAASTTASLARPPLLARLHLDAPAAQPRLPRSRRDEPPGADVAARPPTMPRASAPKATPAEPAPTAASGDNVADRRPEPLTYPVLPLPADDDPHRVGVVRVLLVVSSEGQVVDSRVTAATLSPAYVERVVQGLAMVRFAPATLHGFPHAGWFEVVVEFGFEPPAA